MRGSTKLPSFAAQMRLRNHYANATTILGLLLVVSMPASGQDDSHDHPTLQYQVWSGAINVPDPVALDVDPQGRVFVTQTRRRKSQDLDIRANRDWIPDDVGFQSVDDKRDFYHSRLAIGGDDKEQKKHVGDLNRDGHHDWRDLTVISERIFRLVDKDLDGTADEITTFAEGFNTEVTGIAAGVLQHEGKVFATIAPDVWRLTDEDDDGKADSREVMATGFGLHIAYAGHDMHGLTVGPDGKIYWSIGDKGISVTTADGKEFRYPNEGGVMRCNPDGSDFEVFAHGLRNVQEFAFDQYGNIFGVDNDADQPGERERFVWIVDAMDAGWRCHYQYRGDDYNPWTDERLWQLPGNDHPAYIIPPIQHYMDGPAGFKFNPGTALSPSYRNYFFVTNAPRGHQYGFRVEPIGDSFKMIDAHEIGSGHAIVGLAFGPDGGLYGADWDGGYPLDEKGAVIRIDVPENRQSPLRSETRELLRAGFDDLSVNRLGELLAHADQRVRLGAQFSLVRKRSYATFKSKLDAGVSEMAALHSIWGLGQLARNEDDASSDAIAAIKSALTKPESHTRAQAAKTLGEIPGADGNALIPLLDDESLHVRVNAGLAIARLRPSGASHELLQHSDSLLRTQHYLRHSIVQALASCATSTLLASQAEHKSEMRRLVCVLALRHQASPMVSRFLSDRSNWVATEAARAIHDDNSMVDALAELATCMASASGRPEAFVRRAINANFRIGSITAAERLMQFASDRAQPIEMRIDACRAIGSWSEPPVLDRVEGIRRDLLASRELDQEFAAKSLAAIVQGEEPRLQVAAVSAARKLNLNLPRVALSTLLESQQVPSELRVESLQSLVQSEPNASESEIIESVRSNDIHLSTAAIKLVKHLTKETALDVLKQRIADDPPLRVYQAIVRSLGDLEGEAAESQLVDLASKLVAGSLDSGVSLELSQALKAVSNQEETAQLAVNAKAISKLRQSRARKLKLNGERSTKFAFCETGGDKSMGKKLFETHLQAQCARCHRIGKRGSKIGPELTKIGQKRDRASILRSIVEPSAEIDKKYFTQAVLLESGKIIRGVVKSEDDDEMILIDSSGKEVKIPGDEIEAVSDQKISLMPDMRDTLTPNEVRDLVAYLSSLN